MRQGAAAPPPLSATAIAAAIEESQRPLGCAKCRYARGGCKRCRNPAFTPRGAQPAPQAAGAAAAAAPGQQPARARRVLKGKRQRKNEQGSAGGSEPLLQKLRKQLQGLQTQGSDASVVLPRVPADPAPPAPPPAGPEEADAAPQQQREQPPAAQHPQQQQQQQQKRAAEAGGAAEAGRPAKFFKADPQLAASLQQEQLAAAQAAAAPPASKREASSEPSPTSRRPTKRMRAAHPLPLQPHGHIPAAPGAGAEAGPAPAAAAAAGGGGAAAKRPAAAEHEQRPAKFRRVPQPSPAAAHSPSSSGGSAHMEVDALSPRKRAAAAALERAATGGSSPAGADFLARLQENMQLRHELRQQGGAEPHPLLSGGSKRQRRSPVAARSPAASQGVAAGAAAEEPDPRLCLWEPPVSPYGLLEEELFDDPWKLLVACMLLNKTTSTQVRKVIWDLFALCPTPAAALAADVAAIQALIQPLGLFRKRAAAVQQLSHDFLYKQWRDPTELFGIGKYASDAYHIFCRGRWRDIQPEDKDLRRYREWLGSTGGLGTGLTRHRTMPPAAAGGGGA